MNVGLPKPGLNEFLSELGTLLGDSGTGVFIDASILIDNLKLGPKALKEWTDFLETTLPGRLHIPIWAAHEFQHHLVMDSAGSQARAAFKEMELFGQRLYRELAPALGEADALPSRTAEQHRLMVRGAFLDLQQAAQRLQTWSKGARPDVEKDMVKFIDRHMLRSKAVFENVERIGAVYSNRYEARIPPGFQDRNKAAKANGENSLGSNAAGDLMFWKEVLQFVKSGNGWLRKRYDKILILTNDEKNDWKIGGRPQATPSDNTFRDVDTVWTSLPVPHPMLAFEAQTQCKVSKVALCDGHLLGAYVSSKGVAPTYAIARFHIAVSKRPPSSGSGSKAPTPRVAPAPPPGAPAADGTEPTAKDAQSSSAKPKAELTAAELTSMVAASTPEVDAAVAGTLQRVLAVAAGTAAETLATVLGDADPRALHVACRLGVQMMRDADGGNLATSDAVQQILKSLGTLPPAVATALYSGILFGKYVVADKLTLQPNSLLLDDIVDVEGLPVAQPGIELVRSLADAAGRRPLYLPNADAKILSVHAVTAPAKRGLPRLRSLLVGEQEVMTNLPATDEHLISHLAGLDVPSKGLNLNDLVSVIARFYGVPRSRLRVSSGGSEAFQLEDDAALTSVDDLGAGE